MSESRKSEFRAFVYGDGGEVGVWLCRPEVSIPSDVAAATEIFSVSLPPDSSVAVDVFMMAPNVKSKPSELFEVLVDGGALRIRNHKAKTDLRLYGPGGWWQFTSHELVFHTGVEHELGRGAEAE